LPDGATMPELRSVVVAAGDCVLFTRGVVHTFTAPLDDLTLLSYHAPFYAFDDRRQYSIPKFITDGPFVWEPSRIARTRSARAIATP